jgi:HSP20 family molecular chaperone IbpA
MIPNLDISYRSDACYITAPIPGLRPDGIELAAEGNRLIIVLNPRNLAALLECVIEVTGGFERETARATYRNGVLSIILPVPGQGGSMFREHRANRL